MKKTPKTICIIFLLAVLAVSMAQASISTAQEKALTFIENVLPIDTSKYNITLVNYGIPKLPDIGTYKQNDANEEVLTYSLESKDSTVKVVCTLNNGILHTCLADAKKGAVIADKTYANTADTAKSLLEKYQTYSKLDSTELVQMLANIVPTKNTTITSGDLSLIITHKDLSGTAFGDRVDYRWVRTINGCEYPVLSIAFSDGTFYGLIDQQTHYTIGDPTVNIPREQAIEIAMKYIQNYSYRISDERVVSDFNVTEDKTVASLVPTVKEGNVLYPYWSVILYLNQTYPGSVTSLLLGIWADTGEVFFCNYQAYGGSNSPISTGSENLENMKSDNTSNAESQISPSPLSSETNETAIDLGIVAVIAVVVTAITVATITLIVKKRSK